MGDAADQDQYFATFAQGFFLADEGIAYKALWTSVDCLGGSLKAALRCLCPRQNNYFVCSIRHPLAKSSSVKSGPCDGCMW